MRTILCLLSICSGCAEPEDPNEPGCDGPCELLSEYGFFADLPALTPAAGVVPYEPAAELWSDNAYKPRFFRLPEGERAGFDPVEEWDWPEGSVAIKSFVFPADLRQPEGPSRRIETRLLTREDDDWVSDVYLWNDSQTDASRTVAGDRLEVSYIDLEGQPATHDYIVPNTNQCLSCHTRSDQSHLLGLVTPQVADQLDSDWFTDDPGSGHLQFPDPFGAAPLADRARAWLHANCAHCHRAGGLAGSSGLDLTFWNDVPIDYGVCREPVAAGGGTGGFDYDIVPGSPETSILVYRLQSENPGEKMPELPNLLVPEAGVELVSAWIASLEGDCP